MPQRTQTSRPIHVSNKSKFKFHLGCNSLGFFRSGYGCSFHCGHLQINSLNVLMSGQLLDNSLKENFSTICKEAEASYGVGRNYIHAKTGVMFSRQNIAHLSGINCSAINVSEQSSSESVLDILQKNRYDYVCLYHDAINTCGSNSSNLTIDNVIQSENQEHQYTYELSASKKSEISDFIVQHLYL